MYYLVGNYIMARLQHHTHGNPITPRARKNAAGYFFLIWKYVTLNYVICMCVFKIDNACHKSVFLENFVHYLSVFEPYAMLVNIVVIFMSLSSLWWTGSFSQFAIATNGCISRYLDQQYISIYCACPCGDWCRGLTTFVLYVGFLVWNDSGFVSVT